MRHHFFEFENWNRRANTGDNILALRIHQKLAVKFFVANRRITREAHAGAAGVSQIAKNHRLHIHRGSEHFIDVVDAAIVLGAVILPGAKHSIASHHQLFVRILREVALGVLLDNFFVFFDHFLQRFGVEVGVELGFFLFLLGVENFVEFRLRNFQHDAAKHLNQPAVGIVRKTRIVVALRQRLHALVVNPKFKMVSIMPGMENFAPERR